MQLPVLLLRQGRRGEGQSPPLTMLVGLGQGPKPWPCADVPSEVAAPLPMRHPHASHPRPSRRARTGRPSLPTKSKKIGQQSCSPTRRWSLRQKGCSRSQAKHKSYGQKRRRIVERMTKDQ